MLAMLMLLPAASLILGAWPAQGRAPTSIPGVSPGMPYAHAIGAAADPTRPFGQAWSALPGSQGWQVVVSAPFPLHWPPEPGGHGMPLVRYAYAMRLRAGLADGAEMAAPWARSMEAVDGTTAVTILQGGLHPIGIQGVRPVGPAESALIAREEEAEELLRAGKVDPLVRATTCGWIARNGVVAAATTPLHPAFTQWLACGSAAALPQAGSL